jgi:VanZ family protein
MKSTIYGLRWAVLLVSIYWFFLFIGTHIPTGELIRKIGSQDKLLHALAFSGLSFLLAWAIPTKKNRSHNVIAAGLICGVYAGVDELLQIPVGRTADWHDFYADLLGVVMGLSTYVLGRAMIIASGWQCFDSSLPERISPPE